MNDARNTTANLIDVVRTDEDILTEEVSDDALESAADRRAAATMGPGSCWVPGGRIC